jgi:hypothetical protein
MTLESLMAYTVTDDHRRQLKVFKSLQDWQQDPSSIRAALTEKMVEAGSKLARFVGLDAYQAAGGSSRADLFSNEVYLENPALLNKLAEKKLDGIRRNWRPKAGAGSRSTRNGIGNWFTVAAGLTHGWSMPRPNCSTANRSWKKNWRKPSICLNTPRPMNC